jgi:putative ABC transport system ATP-binding protein
VTFGWKPSLKLDTTTGQQILHLFRRIVDQEGTTILIASHDLAVDAFADEVVHLQDGRITGKQIGGAKGQR